MDSDLENESFVFAVVFFFVLKCIISKSTVLAKVVQVEPGCRTLESV